MMKSLRRQLCDELYDGDVDAFASESAGPRPPIHDTAHPWHQRKQNAIKLIDMPDDERASDQFENFYTRSEVCELLGLSDSGFGKLKIPGRGKSGKYTLYSLGDAMYYRLANHQIATYRRFFGHAPAESVHTIAAQIKAEAQTEHGPPDPIYRPRHGEVAKLKLVP